jgi:HAD superfamily hydrolase (TIGR01509 family)
MLASNRSMISAALLDLDGTLVDSERENAESVARALKKRGRGMSAEEREFVIGHGWREIYDLIERNQPTGLTFDELKHAAAVEKEAILREGGLTVLPGAKEAVERLVEKVPLAVVTGSSREEAELVLEIMGIRELLDALVTTEDVAHGKPAPDGFLLAADRLGVLPPGCLAVEDSNAGIRAALDAGMRCVAVRAGNFAKQDQSDADAVIDTLAELDDALIEKLMVRVD